MLSIGTLSCHDLCWMGLTFNPLNYSKGHHSLAALCCGFVHSLSGLDCATLANSIFPHRPRVVWWPMRYYAQPKSKFYSWSANQSWFGGFELNLGFDFEFGYRPSTMNSRYKFKKSNLFIVYGVRLKFPPKPITVHLHILFEPIFLYFVIWESETFIKYKSGDIQS